ncbi:uncharacterized protein LAESUDRAFT_756159 [Laetiporus sulphureus 93-53]|uniref:Pkinase-domain-containing protein n=1 Tax=Laetiporus sulphureus 93-53 TaxID=1314785 RepID=A0A165G7M0_9APHY|nr:uncharacterized protein LAESUDRAFT_756159 [Laetiporus sulphureus 93-53]KZT09938.1 hypothetical protein LAESUDRAFT_756159 [Laetiporus sulphureus 93-53]
MAAVILTSSKLSISNPFQMISHKRPDAGPLPSMAASSSRLHPPAQQADAPPKTFKRLRSSLEQSLRTATRSKSKLSIPVDESGMISHSNGKGKQRASEEHATQDKSKSRMLSKVSFRRLPTAKDSSSSAAVPPATACERRDGEPIRAGRANKENGRVAGNTSFLTPSLRQASMSSPALPIPSVFTQPFALPSSSTSNVASLASPSRGRSGKAESQSGVSIKDISGPTPLVPRRDSRHSSVAAPTASSREKTRPPPLVLSRSPERHTGSPVPLSPSRRIRDGARSPSSQRSPSPRDVAIGSSRGAAASASHLPFNRSHSPPSAPARRATSPNDVRSSSRTTHRIGPSASSSHLPLTPSTPTILARRPSIDAGLPTDPPRPSADGFRPSVDGRRPSVDIHRPSLDARRPSIDTRRPSIDVRRPSLDHQRPAALSSSPPRAISPISPTRPRAVSPQHNYSPSYSQTRFFNASTTSLSSPPNLEHRELIRSAASFLCKEMLKPPSQVNKSALQPREWEEVEVRLRGLARLERVWGKSGVVGMGSSSQLGTIGAASSNGVSAGGEERERRLFGEALRDGYVLCQLMNKLYPGMVSRIDPREDGFMRTSNVTKFLAACSSVGVHSDDLFLRDDLIESNVESLVRVARTVLALQKLVESPAPERSRYLHGAGNNRGSQSPGPYSSGTSSRGAASSPNLSTAQRPTSPTAPQLPTGRKRRSPTQPLPAVRSGSAIDHGSSSSGDDKTASYARGTNGEENAGESEGDVDDVPPILSPPPRSPLRQRASVERTSVTDSTHASVGDSVRGSMADSVVGSPVRQSQASSYLTESTAFSSLLEMQRSASGNHNKFGTIRTMTTEATSIEPGEMPSFTFTEGSFMAASLLEEYGRKRSSDYPTRPSRERRPSETMPVDLNRVVEEAEESSASSKGGRTSGVTIDEHLEQEREGQQKAIPIKLGKGKWPDDFLDAFSDTRLPSPSPDEPSTPSFYQPLSSSAPRKLAVIGATRSDASVESLSQFPRRPTHRARHSVDTAGLLPKDPLLRRDSSPDNISGQSPSPRIILRRNSSRNGPHRNGIYIPRGDSCSRDSDARVPFPRTVSAEHTAPPSPLDRAGVQSPEAADDAPKSKVNSSNDRPRQPRGRFQSEIDGSSSRRKPRPNSYDEMGAKPRRSRYESMVNLGVVTSNASASDLLSNPTLQDGSAVRQTLIVKEDGKPSTQFQLGNCIGRGQFGAVYRALNLNTGQMVAVKRIRLEGLKEEEIAQLMKEVDLVKSLSHPSIVKYEGMARDSDTLSIVLEYAENGSLGQTLKAFGKLNERLVAGYVIKILEGLHYLHQSDVVHCDLKAANILTTKNGNVKLSDFGVSLNLRAMEREMKDVAGTPNWMAPEVIELKGASTKSDIWSLACTIIELLTGRPPYAEIDNSMSVMFRIVEDDMPPVPDGCSESLKDFLKQCFNKDPAKRPSAEDLCEHEWLKQNWALHTKDLRPQDSIPFLRRVSADYQQRPDILRYLANGEMPEADRATPEQRPHLDHSPSGRRLSNDLEGISPREHSFVRTTFGKPVICRVCNQSVKKSAVLCEQCSLICHVKCSPNAPPTCDLRAQLLLYAQYAESGSPTGQYSNPMELLEALQASAPVSLISDHDFTPRTSLDSASQQPPSFSGHPHPPSAYKVLQAFKRSKSFLTDHHDRSSPVPSSSTPSPVPQAVSNKDNNPQPGQKRSILKRKSDIKERPRSISSNSTGLKSSSMRSAVTATESMSSATRRSVQSPAADADADNDKSDSKISHLTSYSIVSSAGTGRIATRSPGIPGDLPKSNGRDKYRDSKSSNGGCSVQ